MQIAIEASLIQRSNWSESHGHCWELPKLGHQSRVRITGKTFSFSTNFTAEVIKVVFIKAALKKCASVNSWCCVSLEINVVACCAVIFAAEEVIESNFVQRCRRCVTGKVATDSVCVRVCTYHHDRGVPANVCANAALNMFVARKPWLMFASDAVDVRRRNRCWETHLCFMSTFK